MEISWVNFFPLVFFPFKIIVLGIGMYYAIKWHHDQDKKEKAEALERKRAQEAADAPQETQSI
ncbi:hypothetical protein [Thalassobius sp. Cn5-15]|uniref:hypothetical protein n=1 Tax=Thalassobius sp. Cn5-15 TaxID=2917763 RepID=UPI001EF2F25C|nr:hypothetical protein [Thalassobius sp. Cn5-15]MCG7493030.1 hypothetical protein [Thalassobius sp. Cn5-15]